MKEVIKKLDEANELLAGLIKTNEDRGAVLAKKLEAVTIKEKDLADRLAAVVKREDEVKRYGVLDIATAELGKAKNDLALAKKAVDDDRTTLSLKMDALDKAKAELDEIVRIYKINMGNCAKEREALEVARKNMKAEILEQIGKGLK